MSHPNPIADQLVQRADFEREIYKRCDAEDNAMTDHTPTPRPLAAYPNLLAVLEGRVSGRLAEWPSLPPELERLERELAFYKRLESILESREDVRDGPDGEQLPNEAMSILTEWRGPV